MQNLSKVSYQSLPIHIVHKWIVIASSTGLVEVQNLVQKSSLILLVAMLLQIENTVDEHRRSKYRILTILLVQAASEWIAVVMIDWSTL